MKSAVIKNAQWIKEQALALGFLSCGISTDMMPNKANILLKSGGEDTDKVDRIKKDFGFEPQLARNNF